MSIEAGSRVGMVAPDETTFAYLKGRPLAPRFGAMGRGGRPLAIAAHRSMTRCSIARSPSTFRSWFAAGFLGHDAGGEFADHGDRP